MPKIFRSKLEDLMPAEELLFEPTPGFKGYEIYLEHATQHPAKANTYLIEFLIKSFTKPGDTVLDPMAGSGSTGVIAALHGRNAIQVELEQKFWQWMEQARLNVEKTQTLTPKGWIKNICGDARKLSQLLGVETDVAITSPPYSEGIGHDSGDNASDKFKERLEMQRRYTRQMVTDGNIAQLPHGQIDAIVTSPPFGEANHGGGIAQKGYEGQYGKDENLHLRHDRPLSDNPDNISNLPYVDTVITSPPYSNIAKSKQGAISPHMQGLISKLSGIPVKEFAHNVEKLKEAVKIAQSKIPFKYSENPNNIGNLSHGNIDAVITSPPYGETYTGGGDPEKRRERLIKAGYDPKEFLGGKARNAVLKHYDEVDAIITSPPYERQHQGGCDTPEVRHGCIKEKYPSQENIGNLPMGEIDAVITSPPYGNRLADAEVKDGDPQRMSYALAGAQSEQNIGRLPLKEIDAVITSPPYVDCKKAGEVKPEEVEKYAKRWEENVEKRGWNSWGKSFHTPGRLKGIKSLRDGYSKSKENIGNLPLGEIDAVITSPPYQNALHDSMEKREAWECKKIHDAKKGLPVGYSENPDNIGNIKEHGEIDVVITSPPYDGSLEGTTRHTKGGIASRDPALAKTGSYATVMSFGVPVGYSPNPENIGNLKSKDEEYQALVDLVLTSPPYGHESTASKPTNLERQGLFRMGHSKEQPYTEEDYREWSKHKEGNIGKRKLFIRVPCKPEEAQFHDNRPGRKGTIWESTKEVEATPEIIEQVQKLKSERKGKSETYLEAMFKVYSEMFRVLKPGGLAIIIVKPFIRNQKPVDLPWHTWLLMAKGGFQLAKLFKLRLKQQSFWRINYYKKFPHVPLLAHEYVLVCRKPVEDQTAESVSPQLDPLEFELEKIHEENVEQIFKSFFSFS